MIRDLNTSHFNTLSVEFIKNIAIVGAGTMGQGIAQVCAQAGYSVIPNQR